MSDAIDPRLRALDPSRAAARPRVADTDWGRDLAAAITAAPARRRRARRWAGIAVATGAVAAVVALMAVLIVATGGDDPVPAATEVVLVATPVPLEAPPDSALLERAADLVRERARILGVEGVTVTAQGTDGLVLGLPADASRDLVTALTATGELRLYAIDRSLAGPSLTTFEAAVRRAQRDAGVAVRGGGEADVPPGYAVVREDRVLLNGQGAPSYFTAFRGRVALTNGDVEAATVRADAPDPELSLVFTATGAEAFTRATRELAQTGALRGELQVLAVVLDGRLVTNPVIDYELYPTGLDGRTGLVMQVPDDLDPAAVAAQLTTGPLPVRLAPATPAPAADLLDGAYMGLSCPFADLSTCDRVGLSITLRAPAQAVEATVSGRTFPLDDPTWSGPETGGTRLVFAGFLDRSGLRPDDPAWIGDPEVLVPVEVSVTGGDGTVSTTTTELTLRPGWG